MFIGSAEALDGKVWTERQPKLSFRCLDDECGDSVTFFFLRILVVETGTYATKC